MDRAPIQAATGGQRVVRPKYLRLRDELAGMIAGLAAGSAIQTERELCERFGVSRSTVRQALDRLEAEQRITRQQGKGTFVARPKIDQPLELTSHTEHIRARGMDPASRLVAVSELVADNELAAGLGLAPGSDVVQIERLRLADGEPLALELVSLDAHRFKGIAEELSGSVSLYELLRTRYGTELVSAEETIEAVVAPEREAALLGVAPGAPVLLLCRQTFDKAGHPVELVRSHYRADRFRFRTSLVTNGPAGWARLPPGTRFRLATAADGPALARVFVSAWRHSYPGVVSDAVLAALDDVEIADWLGSLTASNGPTTWVVESGGGVTAFARHGEDPLDARRGHIYSLYVAPESGGRGIGRALLERSLQLLADRGLATVTLWVFERNAPARRLYESLGFVPDGARRVEPQYGAQEIRLRRAHEHVPATRAW